MQILETVSQIYIMESERIFKFKELAFFHGFLTYPMKIERYHNYRYYKATNISVVTAELFKALPVGLYKGV